MFVYILCSMHYSDQAVIRDAELCEIIVQLLKGVAGFQFQYDHTSALLNVWQPSSLELAGVSISEWLLCVCVFVCVSVCVCVCLCVCVSVCVCACFR